ncbi:lateral signaling target protein 2 homolog isoform X2 [Artemia franciscana]|nr:hypothetical protein QYM36_011598 [Artemia franciscana]
MDEVLGSERVPRDFRAKFPDDLVLDNLAGQLWFGAECLAAGSSIVNRELESAAMRPLAKALTKTLDGIRNELRNQCLRNTPVFSEKLCETLRIFDRIFSEFELSYVSAMVPVKSASEYHRLQDVIVLFSETLNRALRNGYLTQDAVEFFDPALMFTIPRLAIVNGLILNTDGPLNVGKDAKHMSELFRPFRNLLWKIKDLLRTLSPTEITALEKLLCSQEHSAPDGSSVSIDFTIVAPVKPQRSKMENFTEKELVDGCNDCSKNRSSSSEGEILQQHPRKTRKKRKRSELEGGGKIPRSERKAWELRRRFKSTEDLLHRLFVCISGVADQLQTNFASDLRVILKTVFQIHMPVDEVDLGSNDVQLVPEGVEVECFDNPGEAGQYEETATIMNVNPHLGLANVFLEQNPVPALDSYLLDSSALLAPPSESVLNSPESTVSDLTLGQDEPSTSSECKAALMKSDSNSLDSGNGTTDKDFENVNKSDEEDIKLPNHVETVQESIPVTESRQVVSASQLYAVDIPSPRFQGVNDVSETKYIDYTEHNSPKPILSPSNDEAESTIWNPVNNGEASPFGNRAIAESEMMSPIRNQNASQDVDDIRSLLDILGIGEIFRNDNVPADLVLATPPEWIPDDVAPDCMQCSQPFTVIRRRHHCRNCGKVFCNRCSARSVPLPRYGYSKPVRVCEICFKFQLSHFNITDASIS